MAQQGPSFGKVVLYGVIGVIAVIVGINVITWFFSNIFGWLLVAAAVAGVGYIGYRIGQRSVGGGSSRRQLPR